MKDSNKTSVLLNDFSKLGEKLNDVNISFPDRSISDEFKLISNNSRIRARSGLNIGTMVEKFVTAAPFLKLDQKHLDLPLKKTKRSWLPSREGLLLSYITAKGYEAHVGLTNDAVVGRVGSSAQIRMDLIDLDVRYGMVNDSFKMNKIGVACCTKEQASGLKHGTFSVLLGSQVTACLSNYLLESNGSSVSAVAKAGETLSVRDQSDLKRKDARAKGAPIRRGDLCYAGSYAEKCSLKSGDNEVFIKRFVLRADWLKNITLTDGSSQNILADFIISDVYFHASAEVRMQASGTPLYLYQTHVVLDLIVSLRMNFDSHIRWRPKSYDFLAFDNDTDAMVKQSLKNGILASKFDDGLRCRYVVRPDHFNDLDEHVKS